MVAVASGNWSTKSSRPPSQNFSDWVAVACCFPAAAVVRNDRFTCAPCKGGAFQWVQAPPGETLQPEATGAVMF